MDDQIRAADRDRDEVAAILREQYAEGRLTLEEFDERSSAAYAAKTLGELRLLTADLPVTREPQPAAPPPAHRIPARAAAVVAAVAVVLGVTIIAGVTTGHVVVAWPSWLVVFFVLRLVRGGRTSRCSSRGSRPGAERRGGMYVG